jgi:STE24 endopeptidase
MGTAWAIPLLLLCTRAHGFDADEATRAYLDAFTAEEIANTNGYVNTGYVITLIDVVAAILAAWLMLASGWSRRWRDWAEARFSNVFPQAFIYVPIYLLASLVLLFPLDWFRDFYTEHKYGLATQTFADWLVEHLQGALIGAVLVSILVGLLYGILRRSPERWWLWGAGLVTGFMLFVIFISPVYVQPVFNDYRPMDEGPLKERIISIARANGMQADDVMQVDQSKQTNRVSANVSGLFGTARIALNDNLLNRASDAAVEAVMAHEIGHYVLNHISKSMTYFLLIIVVCFALANLVFKAMLSRRGTAWGIRGIDDYAGFPLLFAIVTVLLFLATPLLYRLTYIHEYEADLFAINATQDPEAWAEVSLMTAEYRKLHPPAWEENWLNHHPSPYQRIYTAMRWKAENLPARAVEPSGQ